MFLGDGLFLGLPHHHETWQNAADIYIYIYILSMSMGQETGHCDLRSLRHCHRQTSGPPELNDFVVASSQPAGQEALWRAKGEAWEVR